jgi:hypothetical protein
MTRQSKKPCPICGKHYIGVKESLPGGWVEWFTHSTVEDDYGSFIHIRTGERCYAPPKKYEMSQWKKWNS